MTTQNPNELFYIGIKHKNELRRAILESSKEMIHALKAYRHVKELEHQKTEMLHDLNKIMADIRKLDGKLKTQLPKLTLPKIRPKQAANSLNSTFNNQTIQTASSAKSSTGKVPATIRPKLSEVDKLEQELQEIENKLNQIRS